ncbi:hypothetical protein EMIT0P218_10343 [Pseudomonas sp. IT-P218]
MRVVWKGKGRKHRQQAGSHRVCGVSGTLSQAKKKALLSKTFLNFGAPRGQRSLCGGNVPYAAIPCDARLCWVLAMSG